MEILLLLLFCAGLLTNSGRYRVPVSGKSGGFMVLLAKLPFYALAVVVGFLIFAVANALLNA